MNTTSSQSDFRQQREQQMKQAEELLASVPERLGIGKQRCMQPGRLALCTLIKSELCITESESQSLGGNSWLGTSSARAGAKMQCNLLPVPIGLDKAVRADLKELGQLVGSAFADRPVAG